MAVLFLLAIVYGTSAGWGFWAHREINRRAIESLPLSLHDFFSANEDYIVEHSIDPDQRRFGDKEEEFYHYLDIDRYGRYPFSELPHDYTTAAKKYGQDSLKKNGLVPWRIEVITAKLTDAMKRANKGDILYYAADLGHYVADACVPLHATENYNGQLSGQTGIHSRFESRLPEMFGKDYQFFQPRVGYVENPLERAFQIILKSYTLADSVLKADLKAKADSGENEAFLVGRKNGKTEYRYSDKYYARFNGHLNGIVENRMRDAISAVADYWFTAWVKAGKPDLRR